MKFIEFIAKGIGCLWKFLSNIITISFIAVILLFGITVFIPQNVTNAIEIFKKLLQIP